MPRHSHFPLYGAAAGVDGDEPWSPSLARKKDQPVRSDVNTRDANLRIGQTGYIDCFSSLYDLHTIRERLSMHLQFHSVMVKDRLAGLHLPQDFARGRLDLEPPCETGIDDAIRGNRVCACDIIEPCVPEQPELERAGFDFAGSAEVVRTQPALLLPDREVILQ